jgi:hypothetical protein
VESQYALISFGIPVKSLQVNSDGDLKRAPHLKWLTLRKKTEHMVCDSNGTMKQIVVPSRMDVLFGRGTPLRSHVGNMRLTDLIEEDLEKYFSSSKKAGKAAVVNSLIKTINNEGRSCREQCTLKSKCCSLYSSRVSLIEAHLSHVDTFTRLPQWAI